MPNIYLISGPTQSEKTTRLIQWASGRKNVGGLVSPILFGRRCFQDIWSGEWVPMEAELNETDIQQVGRYTFSGPAFNWANHVLINAYRQPEIKWLIIDEIGPLELQGNGLTPALDHIFYNLREDQNLILVIREKIADSVLLLYNLYRYPVLHFTFEEHY